VASLQVSFVKSNFLIPFRSEVSLQFKQSYKSEETLLGPHAGSVISLSTAVTKQNCTHCTCCKQMLKNVILSTQKRKRKQDIKMEELE
jgi:hypothetical protein